MNFLVFPSKFSVWIKLLTGTNSDVIFKESFVVPFLSLLADSLGKRGSFFATESDVILSFLFLALAAKYESRSLITFPFASL